MQRRSLFAIAAILLAVAAMTPLVLPRTANASPSMEQQFISNINALRSSRGLPSLAVHSNLTAKARSWAQNMAGAGHIYHSDLQSGITANWKRLGENVGVGSDVNSLHNAFVASPTHYENLVDPTFTHVGVGVFVGSDGTVWVAEEFMQLMDSTPATTRAPATTQAPATTRPPTPVATRPVVTQPPAPITIPAAPVTTRPVVTTSPPTQQPVRVPATSGNNQSPTTRPTPSNGSGNSQTPTTRQAPSTSPTTRASTPTTTPTTTPTSSAGSRSTESTTQTTAQRSDRSTTTTGSDTDSSTTTAVGNGDKGGSSVLDNLKNAAQGFLSMGGGSETDTASTTTSTATNGPSTTADQPLGDQSRVTANELGPNAPKDAGAAPGETPRPTTQGDSASLWDATDVSGDVNFSSNVPSQLNWDDVNADWRWDLVAEATQ